MNSTSDEQEAVIKQAIEWHQRLGEGDLDARARREFSAWLEHPAHAEELARICLIHTLVKHSPLESKKRPPLPENVIDFQYFVPSSRPRAPQLPNTPRATSRFSTRIATAASTVVVAVALTFAGVLTKDQTIVTREGRWDKQLLDDGTVVYAGPSTRLRFKFDTQKRAVTLLHGEALFEVAKVPGRPFIVTTDVGSVQSMGTTFATAELGDEVVVTVASGKVAVTSPAAGVEPMLPIGANQQVVLSAIGVSEPMQVNAERELKWIRNWYEYDGEPVGEIVGQLNRRNKVQVIVDDPQVKGLRMSSLAFRPSDPQVFVSSVNRWCAGYAPRLGNPAGARGAAVLHLQRS